MRFKFTYIASVLCLLSFGVNAQMIKFTINLPASFEMSELVEQPVIIEPLKDKSVVKAQENIRWIEIRSRENVELIVSMSYDRRRPARGMGRLYFLNDGTFNFINASLLPFDSKTTVLMNNSGKTIDQMPNSPAYLSAWLGLPANQGGVLTIIYP